MSNEGVTLTLRVDKLPLDKCYGLPAEFVSNLPEYLSVLLTGSIGDVIVSPSEPSVDDAGKIWMKITTNRDFIGLFQIKHGKWVQVSDAYVNEIRWFDSSVAIPEGWTAISKVKGEDIKQEGVAGAVSVPTEYTLARYNRS